MLERFARSLAPALLPQFIACFDTLPSLLPIVTGPVLARCAEFAGDATIRASMTQLLDKCRACHIALDYKQLGLLIESETSAAVPDPAGQVSGTASDNSKAAFLLWLQLGLVERNLIACPSFGDTLGRVLRLWAAEVRTGRPHQEMVVGSARFSLSGLVQAWTEYFSATADRSWLLWVLDCVQKGTLAPLPDSFLAWAAPEVARKRWASAAREVDVPPVCALLLCSVPFGHGVALDLLERLARSDRRAELCRQGALVAPLVRMLNEPHDVLRYVTLRVSVALMQVLSDQPAKLALATGLRGHFRDLLEQSFDAGVSFGGFLVAVARLRDGALAAELTDALLARIDAVIPETAAASTRTLAGHLTDLLASMPDQPELRPLLLKHVPVLLGAAGCTHGSLRKAAISVSTAWPRQHDDWALALGTGGAARPLHARANGAARALAGPSRGDRGWRRLGHAEGTILHQAHVGHGAQ